MTLVFWVRWVTTVASGVVQCAFSLIAGWAPPEEMFIIPDGDKLHMLVVFAGFVMEGQRVGVLPLLKSIRSLVQHSSWVAIVSAILIIILLCVLVVWIHQAGIVRSLRKNCRHSALRQLSLEKSAPANPHRQRVGCACIALALTCFAYASKTPVIGVIFIGLLRLPVLG